MSVNGSFSLPFRSTGTTSTTITSSDYTINCNNAATAITVTLPSAVNIRGRIYIIKRDQGSTGTVTINSSGGTIQATSGTFGTTTTLTALNTAGMYQSDGINWHRIGN
ncbi:MAG: hypothetical protein U5L45_00290 [Saprospiraceae bacterium]|nr:hypothetical protein [Saprospiraceae bacterium]